MFKRLIASFICLTFSFSNLQQSYVQANPATGGDFSINQLPVPGTMVGKSAPFVPLALKGLVVNLNNPLEFQFIVDTGSDESLQGQKAAVIVRSEATNQSQQEQLKQQANQLVKYFLAGLTIPEGDLWVNLSPYEKTRMVPEALGQTDLGRDLLAQDYILKQLTASLIYPEKDLGKEFWSRVYAKAQQQFGTTNIPVNTFNKVWILPNQAQVFENNNAAYVTKSTLKVMLDEDYLATEKNRRQPGRQPRDMFKSELQRTCPQAGCQADKPSNVKANQGVNLSQNIRDLGKQIIKEIILPEIEKEVNHGRNFAPLRQIYQALILAKWYKETITNGLLDATYTNKNKVAGVNLNDPTVKEQIYNRYLQAYKKGAFNYIKEDPTPDGQVVPRKYFSGGFKWIVNLRRDGAKSSVRNIGQVLVVTFSLLALIPSGSAFAQQQTPSTQTQLPATTKSIDLRPIVDRKINPSVEFPNSIRFNEKDRDVEDKARYDADPGDEVNEVDWTDSRGKTYHFVKDMTKVSHESMNIANLVNGTVIGIKVDKIEGWIYLRIKDSVISHLDRGKSVFPLWSVRLPIEKPIAALNGPTDAAMTGDTETFFQRHNMVDKTIRDLFVGYFNGTVDYEVPRAELRRSNPSIDIDAVMAEAKVIREAEIVADFGFGRPDAAMFAKTRIAAWKLSDQAMLNPTPKPTQYAAMAKREDETSSWVTLSDGTRVAKSDVTAVIRLLYKIRIKEIYFALPYGNIVRFSRPESVDINQWKIIWGDRTFKDSARGELADDWWEGNIGGRPERIIRMINEKIPHMKGQTHQDVKIDYETLPMNYSTASDNDVENDFREKLQRWIDQKRISDEELPQAIQIFLAGRSIPNLKQILTLSYEIAHNMPNKMWYFHLPTETSSSNLIKWRTTRYDLYLVVMRYVPGWISFDDLNYIESEMAKINPDKILFSKHPQLRPLTHSIFQYFHKGEAWAIADIIAQLQPMRRALSNEEREDFIRTMIRENKAIKIIIGSQPSLKNAIADLIPILVRFLDFVPVTDPPGFFRFKLKEGLNPNSATETAVNPGPDAAMRATVRGLGTDRTTLAQLYNGGIDLNQIKVNRTGKTINVQFDPAQLIQLEQGGFKGFTPVITSMTHISSPFQLLGINISLKEVQLAKV
jgi:hypothetical protein